MTETMTDTNGDFTRGHDIDVHAHWFPPRIVEAFDTLGSRKAWPPHGDSLSERAEQLTYSTFSTQILGMEHNQPSFTDRAAALHCAQLLLDMLIGHSGKP